MGTQREGLPLLPETPRGGCALNDDPPDAVPVRPVTQQGFVTQDRTAVFGGPGGCPSGHAGGRVHSRGLVRPTRATRAQAGRGRSPPRTCPILACSRAPPLRKPHALLLELPPALWSSPAPSSRGRPWGVSGRSPPGHLPIPAPPTGRCSGGGFPGRGTCGPRSALVCRDSNATCETRGRVPATPTYLCVQLGQLLLVQVGLLIHALLVSELHRNGNRRGVREYGTRCSKETQPRLSGCAGGWGPRQQTPPVSGEPTAFLPQTPHVTGITPAKVRGHVAGKTQEQRGHGGILASRREATAGALLVGGDRHPHGHARGPVNKPGRVFHTRPSEAWPGKAGVPAAIPGLWVTFVRSNPAPPRSWTRSILL